MTIVPGEGAGTSPGAGEPRRAAGRLTGRLAGLPLWLKLATVVVCLVGVGLAVIGVAGVSVFRSYLMRQTDQQVRQGALQLAGRSFIVGPTGGPELSGPGDLVVQVLGAGGQPLEVVGPGAGPGPIRDASVLWISAHTGQLVTLPADAAGESWRVILEPVRYQAKYFVPSEFGADNYAVVDASRATAGLRGTLVVGKPLGGIGQRLGHVSAGALGIGVVVLAALAFGVAALTRGSWSWLSEVEGLARAVGRGQWSSRLPERQPSAETGSIARSLNVTLDRAEEAARARAAADSDIAAARDRAARRVAEAGQQLRGPLSVLAGLAEHYARRGAPTAAEADRLMNRVLTETSRMSETIDGLIAPDPPTRSGPAGTGTTGTGTAGTDA